jgi:hypothetical protein
MGRGNLDESTMGADRVKGGMSILLMDALLFIPLIMAAFFYPWASLMVAVVLVVASFVGYEAWVIWERKHHA